MDNALSNNMFETIFERCAVGMTQVSTDGKFVRVNAALCDFLGYTEQEFLQLTFQQITHSDYLTADLDNVQRLIDGKADDYSMEKLYRHKKGHYLWGKLTVSIVRDSAKKPLFFISVVENIQDKKQAEDSLQVSELKFKTIVELLSDNLVVWVTEPHFSRTLYVNSGYEIIWGRSAKELYADPESFMQLIHPDDQAAFKHALLEHQHKNWRLSYRIVRDDGHIRYIESSTFDLFDAQQAITSQIHVARDCTDYVNSQRVLEEQNKQLEKIASIDTLTQVANRHTIINQINQEFERCLRHSLVSTLVFLDLNNFKHINDQFGHLVGDQALRHFAQNIREGIRCSDMVGRFGGDEFIVLLPETNLNDAKTLLGRMQFTPLNLKEPHQNLHLSASIGYAEFSAEVQSVEHWLELADSTMYQAKSA